MKVFLMHHSRDFGQQDALPPHAASLTQDLELDTLLRAMAGGDQFLFETAKRALLLSQRDPDQIVYRQQVMRDCLENPGVTRELYALAGAALHAERRIWGWFQRDSPERIVGVSVQRLSVLVGFLRRLRDLTKDHAPKFASSGLTRFCEMLADELDESYLQSVETGLEELEFKRGVLMSARLTAGNKGTEYLLRRPHEQSFFKRVFDRSGLSFTIPERDESGFKALADLRDRGMNEVANALAQSVEHVLGFFTTLRAEVGFYVACVNLAERLAEKREPTTFPTPRSTGELQLAASALYDVSLSLTMDGRVVGNDLSADSKSLVVITGANQGGKSTFLRAVGQAQLMMQAGMFVGAESFTANVSPAVFTHFKREEDETMESGKLDEELARMSQIADHITSQCMLLCNESFASTNEREGSEIARQVVRALVEGGIKVLFVTHLFDLASSFHGERSENALFLRAERGRDGARPFKISEGEPLPTSFGEDAYRRVFGQTAPEAGVAQRSVAASSNP